MRSRTTLSILGVAILVLSGCASVPDKAEMQRLDGASFKSDFVGNTLTNRTDYGRWADYLETSTSGYGKASGSWGSESATASFEIADDGEGCWVYTGPHEWSTPEHEYCAVFYTDAEGNYYSEKTKDTYKPNTVGNIKKVEIKSGDAYGLSE